MRIDALMHMQRDRWHFKRAVLFLSRPHQLRIKMRIIVQFLARFYRWHRGNVVVSLVGGRNGIGLGRHQPNGRVVNTFFVPVFIALYRALWRLAAALLASWHLFLTFSRTGLWEEEFYS